jgi:amidase
MRALLNAKIPSEWLIPRSILSSLPQNVEPLIESVNILTKHELEITRAQDATAILENIRSKAWSAEEVCVAFCKRAALAHQLVNCLMDIDFEGALKRAKELDEYQNKMGKLVGPMHGLPFSFKVTFAAHAMINERAHLGYRIIQLLLE